MVGSLLGLLREHEERPSGQPVVDPAVLVLVADALADLDGQALGFDRHEAAVEEAVEVGAEDSNRQGRGSSDVDINASRA